MPGQGSGETPLSEAQGFRFFVIVQLCPADALLSPEPGGRLEYPVRSSRGTGLCTSLCVISYLLRVVFVLLLFFSTKCFPP